jgi:hypothetical protein
MLSHADTAQAEILRTEPATMPQRLQRYSLEAMQAATLACYRELCPE